jgi:hypothetical protein
MPPDQVSSFEKEMVSVMSETKSKNSRATQVKQLILGIGKHYPDGSQSIPVGGATFTVTALTQLMQDFVDQRAAVETAKAAVQAKVGTERSRAPSQLAVIRAFETIVRGTFGNSADVLADFGLAPPKARVPMTAEQKAVAAVKREATRAARHTMGKNQKKAVKGAIDATLVVTPAAGSTPTAAPGSNVSSGNAPPAAPPPVNVPTGNAPAGGTTPHA